ncbi:MAG: RNA polymerase-binding protein DksA [Gammaproteobacteria bacterium]
MTKRKNSRKKPAKKPSAFRKLAARAMKLVKKKTEPRARAAPRPAHSRPAEVAKPKPRPIERNEFVSVGGRVLSESEVRKMPESAYMNDTQLEFFRGRLLQMRAEVVDREVDVKERLHQRESFADPADRATAEEEHWLDLRLRERESLLLRKIDDALRRIRDREYGYCEVTGEPIGIPRLLARPTATVCVDVKGQNEQIESQFRDR